MITLKATADYGQAGQFIARITGRDSKFTFEREFLGRKSGKRNETTTVDIDTEGLYECCDIHRKRGKQSSFYLVCEVAGTPIQYNSDKEDAMAVAKAMDSGRKFAEIVSADDEGYEILDPKQAEQRQVAQTIETAVGLCWTVIETLSSTDALAVLDALEKRLANLQINKD